MQKYGRPIGRPNHPELRARVIDLWRTKQYTKAQIARLVGVHVRTARTWIAEADGVLSVPEHPLRENLIQVYLESDKSISEIALELGMPYATACKIINRMHKTEWKTSDQPTPSKSTTVI